MSVSFSIDMVDPEAEAERRRKADAKTSQPKGRRLSLSFGANRQNRQAPEIVPEPQASHDPSDAVSSDASRTTGGPPPMVATAAVPACKETDAKKTATTPPAPGRPPAGRRVLSLRVNKNPTPTPAPAAPTSSFSAATSMPPSAPLAPTPGPCAASSMPAPDARPEYQHVSMNDIIGSTATQVEEEEQMVFVFDAAPTEHDDAVTEAAGSTVAQNGATAANVHGGSDEAERTTRPLDHAATVDLPLDQAHRETADGEEDVQGVYEYHEDKMPHLVSMIQRSSGVGKDEKATEKRRAERFKQRRKELEAFASARRHQFFRAAPPPMSSSSDVKNTAQETTSSMPPPPAPGDAKPSIDLMSYSGIFRFLEFVEEDDPFESDDDDEDALEQDGRFHTVEAESSIVAGKKRAVGIGADIVPTSDSSDDDLFDTVVGHARADNAQQKPSVNEKESEPADGKSIGAAATAKQLLPRPNARFTALVASSRAHAPVTVRPRAGYYRAGGMRPNVASSMAGLLTGGRRGSEPTAVEDGSRSRSQQPRGPSGRTSPWDRTPANDAVGATGRLSPWTAGNGNGIASGRASPEIPGAGPPLPASFRAHKRPRESVTNSGVGENGGRGEQNAEDEDRDHPPIRMLQRKASEVDLSIKESWDRAVAHHTSSSSLLFSASGGAGSSRRRQAFDFFNVADPYPTQAHPPLSGSTSHTTATSVPRTTTHSTHDSANGNANANAATGATETGASLSTSATTLVEKEKVLASEIGDPSAIAAELDRVSAETSGVQMTSLATDGSGVAGNEENTVADEKLDESFEEDEDGFMFATV